MMRRSLILYLLVFLAMPGLQAQSTPELFNSLQFRNIGPTRGGRVTAVEGVVRQPGTFYMGATGGGVWKTTDYGADWTNVSDGFFATPSIGAITVAPSNPDVLYVGTGSDGIRSNVIEGKGVYRSLDGGKHWTHIGLKKTGQIGAVEVHPDNPDVVFVAAIGNAFAPNPERGVFRTTDGGATWEKVLFISEHTGFADLEFHPYDPNIIYAAAWEAERKPWTIKSGGEEGGLWRSDDGGDTWQKLGGGLPSGVIGKIDLAVAQAKPDLVYALVEAPEGEGGLYRSDNKGATWELVSTFAPLLDRPFYYCNVDVNPLNPNTLYVNSTGFWISYDGGKSWNRGSTPHGDNHEIWINPTDTLEWIQCNDGGANVTRDGGRTWSTQHNQSTAELYQVEVDDQYPYKLYAGQQDNTTLSLPSDAYIVSAAGYNGLWEEVGGCETGPAVPKPGNPYIVYSNCKGRFGVYDRRTGQERQYYVGAGNMYGHNPKDLAYRFQRVSPIHVSPHNPDVVYHTSQFVHKTTDDGVTWETISPDLTAFEPDKQVISGSPITRDVTGEEFYSTIYAIRESTLKEGLIWVGANDGPVHITRNGGKKWNQVTPDDLAPGGRVDCVEPSPHDPDKGYFTVLRYQLGDPKPYIYKTENLGKKWTLLTDGANGIPADFPVRVVREDPEREGLLYAGTEYGLFISFDDGANWMPFQQNLPVTPITDIKVYRGDLLLSTMGRGFWILDDLSAVHAAKDELLAGGPHLVQPMNTVRMRLSGRGRGAPEYPGSEVLFHYYLPEAVEGPLTMEILDGSGKVIRAFSSERPARNVDPSEREPDMATGFLIRGYNRDLKKDPGLHRISWDMRHQGSWNANPARSGVNGPMVAPGNYRVRLHVGDQAMEKAFNLLPDPNVTAAGVAQSDLKVQEMLSLRIVDLQSKALRLADALSQKMKAAGGDDAEPEVREKMERLDRELNTAEGRYMQPMLLDQIRYLGSMLNRADQKPGRDAYQRFEQLKQWYEGLLPDWAVVSGEDASGYRLEE